MKIHKIHRAAIRTPFLIFLAILFLLSSACAEFTVSENLPTPHAVTVLHTATAQVTKTPSPTATGTPVPTVTPTPTQTPTQTPVPFEALTIVSLRERLYGGGVIEDMGSLNGNGTFKRRLFKYRSEGLSLYGFIDIPAGAGPFPVIVMLHGYVEPAEYTTIAYSARYADALAEEGFLVVHPNLRGYPPSQDGPNQLGVGDTIDTLNLISLIRSQAGSPGILQKADADQLGIWGHSMGGGIVMRSILVDDDIAAALLYAPIHTNEEFNLAHFEKDGRGREKLNISASSLSLISPFSFLDQIDVSISVHHGTDDQVVPVFWSEELCGHLEGMGKEVECRLYDGYQHTFKDDGDAVFMDAMISFFKESLD